MKVEYTSKIKKNKIKDYRKPNEDYILADKNSNLFIVADGVTRDKVNGNYPSPSPSREVAQIFCKSTRDCFKRKEKSKKIRESLFCCLKNANDQIMKYNLSRRFSTFLPGAVAIVAHVENFRLHLGFVGDCFCILIRENMAIKLTNSQTRLIKLHSTKFTSEVIRDEICNNISHPYGFGVFTGQNGALDFIEYKEVGLKPNDRIILASDGLENFFKTDITKIESLDAETIITEAERVEKGRSDDKSVISLEIKNSNHNEDIPSIS